MAAHGRRWRGLDLRRILGRARETAAALSVQVLTMGSALVVFPIVASSLGPADYGVYTTIYAISGFITLWAWSSSAATVVQVLLQLERSLASVMRVARRRVFAWALPGVVVGVGLAVASFGADVWLPASIILVTEIVVMGHAELNNSAVFAIEGTEAASRVRAVQPVLRTAGVVLLKVLDTVDLTSLALVSLASTMCTWAISRAVARKLTTDGAADDREETTGSEMGKLARLYALSMSTNVLLDQGDKYVMAAAKRPEAELGEYGAAYRMVSLAMVPMDAVNVVATRWFLEARRGRGLLLRKAMLLLAIKVAFGVLAGATLILIQPITQRLVGSEFTLAVQITVWLCALPLARGVADIPLMGLIGLGKNRVRVVLGVFGAVVTLGAYIALIPAMGWKGAVIGTYVAEFVTAVAGWALLVVHQRRADADEPDEPMTGAPIVSGAV